MGRTEVIVLDTHVWVWYINSPDDLSSRALEAIADAKEDSAVYISSISAWEIYMLESNGRLEMKIPALSWVRKCERLSFLKFVPVDNEIVRLAVQLPEEFRPDPADRMIIATSLILGASLVTKDRRILDYEHVQTIW
jgi:PIN domain nuclease of toxin-antitoxin system